MKTDLHPETNEVTIRCACGAEFSTTSIRESVSVEICSKCHPVYTGKKKSMDQGGRVERFQRKYGDILNTDEEEPEEEDSSAEEESEAAKEE